MRNINMLYKGKQELQKCLTESEWNVSDQCFVRIYTANSTMDEALIIAKEIKEVLPNAEIIGASGSGVIYEGQQYDEETLLIIEKMEGVEILVKTFEIQDKSAAYMAQEIANSIEGKKVPMMHILFGNHYKDVHNFVEEFNLLNDSTKLVGGVVGDILPQNLTGYVFNEECVMENGAICAAIISSSIYTFSEVNIAHTPISTYYNLEQCEGSFVLKIENRSAVDWCREQLGMEDMTEYNDWQLIAENDALIRFPLILEGHSGASRFIKYDSASQKMSLYFSELNSNTKFRIGYTSPIACVQECFNICNSMMKTPIESLFCYTCLFRKLYLGNCAEWELRPFISTEICGVFMMGEIGNINGKNEFFNGASSFVGMADQEVYVEPNFTIFEDLYKIKDDNQNLVNFVFQKQSMAMSKENEQLMEQLLLQQQEEKEKLYIDVNTGMQNSIKYSQDNQEHPFDKMCLIHIENYELLISKLGQDGYHAMLRKIALQVSEYIKAAEYKDSISHYTLNSNVMFMAATDKVSEAKFMEIVNDLYDKYQFIKSDSGGEFLVNRFIVVMNQKDLLVSGLATLQNGKNLQTHFLVSDGCIIDNPAISNEMEMINILNYAISMKKIIPYFQGIYSNEERKINKYEALMRLQDAEGKIYVPYDFMDIAKKYHMYSSLSKQMIQEVFHIFAGKEEMVSINLSAYDINYDEMQNFIFQQLDQLENADNFIFEILEDENFRDMDRLRKFIDRVREYGVSIAIDDFGSGYSNFMEIVKIEPDYIKVDMSIVRNIDTSLINQKVLENILFLGKQLNAKLVAEGVENAQIQEKIEDLGVHFSQGFHFARPVPFAAL